MVSGRVLGVAMALLVMGVLSLLVEVQSPSWVLLSGNRVEGYSQGGLAYYTVGGTDYTLDNPAQRAGDTTRIPTTVFVDRNDPTRARLDGPARWFDLVFVLGWPLAAVLVLLGEIVLVATGAGHRRSPGEGFGLRAPGG